MGSRRQGRGTVRNISIQPYRRRRSALTVWHHSVQLCAWNGDGVSGRE